MSSPHHSRALALFLSVLPGWGHVCLGREALGLLIFTLASLSLFGLLNVVLLFEGQHRPLLVRGLAACALFFWLLSVGDVWRRTSPRRRRRIEEEKGRLLKAGMIAYLKDELEAAEESFRSCLALDGKEVEALLRLGVVAARRGAAGRARRWFRRALRLDLEGKWTWEIQRELEALKEKPAAEDGPGPPAGRGAGVLGKGRAPGGRSGPEAGGAGTEKGKAAALQSAPAAPASDAKG